MIFGISLALLATHAIAFVAGGLIGWVAKAKTAIQKLEADATSIISAAKADISNVKKDL